MDQTQKEAGILWEALKDESELTKKLIDLIPHESTHRMTKVASKFGEGVSFAGECLDVAAVGASHIATGAGCAAVAVACAGCAAVAVTYAGVGAIVIPAAVLFKPQYAHNCINWVRHNGKSFITDEFKGAANYIYRHSKLCIAGSKLQQQGKGIKESIDRVVEDHEALKLAHNIVKDKLCKEVEFEIKFQKLKPNLAKDVSNLLDTILQGNKEASSSRVLEFIDSIKPYIYGRTPMVKALAEAKEVFDNNTEIYPKVLFILSDGCATDGDPVLILQELEKSNVIVVTCCFTS